MENIEHPTSDIECRRARKFGGSLDVPGGSWRASTSNQWTHIGALNRGRIQSAREASWTAATESSESPLWVGVTVSAVSFGVLSAAPAKAVTAQTPSPHSKTWRLFRRFMRRENGRQPVGISTNSHLVTARKFPYCYCSQRDLTHLTKN